MLFKNVNSKTYRGKSEKLNIIDITVEEMPTGEIMAGAGTGTSGSSITFGISSWSLILSLVCLIYNLYKNFT